MNVQRKRRQGRSKKAKGKTKLRGSPPTKRSEDIRKKEVEKPALQRSSVEVPKHTTEAEGDTRHPQELEPDPRLCQAFADLRKEDGWIILDPDDPDAWEMAHLGDAMAFIDKVLV